MSPLRWDIFRNLNQTSESQQEPKQTDQEPSQIKMADNAVDENQPDQPAPTIDREKKAGMFEWAWFIAWGLLIPMLFFLFYGLIGLLVGLVLFGIYMMLVYISVKPEEERKGLEEKAERFHKFLDVRTESLAHKNRELVYVIRRSVVRNLPGFRTQTLWKMFVATLFYLLSLMIILLAFSQGRFGLALILAITGALFVSGTQDETL